MMNPRNDNPINDLNGNNRIVISDNKMTRCPATNWFLSVIDNKSLKFFLHGHTSSCVPVLGRFIPGGKKEKKQILSHIVNNVEDGGYRIYRTDKNGACQDEITCNKQKRKVIQLKLRESLEKKIVKQHKETQQNAESENKDEDISMETSEKRPRLSYSFGTSLHNLAKSFRRDSIHRKEMNNKIVQELISEYQDGEQEETVMTKSLRNFLTREVSQIVRRKNNDDDKML
jgi:hypothetical protein